MVLVGQDPASQVYVRNKIRACGDVGFDSRVIRISAAASPNELRDALGILGTELGVDGVLVQLPLPSGWPSQLIDELLPVEKDVDGLTSRSLGQFFLGQELVAPCTPQGVIHLLQHYQIPLQGSRAVVVGRSHIVGLPMAHLLLRQNATVTVCHSRTQNLVDHTRAADLVVVAVGKPHLLGRDDFKRGAVVVDVGIHGSGSGTELRGDVRVEGLEDWCAAITPVPGGVGPMTICTLLENTLTLANLRMANG